MCSAAIPARSYMLHRAVDVQRGLTRLIGVDDGRDGHLARDAARDLHHVGGRDHAPVRHTEIRHRHHVAADVDHVESARLGELAGNHGVRLRRDQKARAPAAARAAVLAFDIGTACGVCGACAAAAAGVAAYAKGDRSAGRRSRAPQEMSARCWLVHFVPLGM